MKARKSKLSCPECESKKTVIVGNMDFKLADGGTKPAVTILCKDCNEMFTYVDMFLSDALSKDDDGAL